VAQSLFVQDLMSSLFAGIFCVFIAENKKDTTCCNIGVLTHGRKSFQQFFEKVFFCPLPVLKPAQP
jgi:hypothetical protein